jgi:tetraacyldisaccharide 4'-kinase
MKFLKIFEPAYHFISSVRNFFYDQNFISKEKLGVPVISVGNLSFGGVGKTPCIIFLASQFSKEFNVAVVCKSYRTQLKSPHKVDLLDSNAPQLFGDEPCVIQQALPTCHVWSGPKKFKTARAALSDSPDIIFVDDAFSHRKLFRNFDLVLIDATVGFNTYLRESKKNLIRCNAVLITKVNLVNQNKVSEIEKQILKLCPQLTGSIYQSQVETRLNIEKRSQVMIFCGLANPESFFHDVEGQKMDIIKKEIFTDHHRYTIFEQKNILAKFMELRRSNPNLKLLTTHKDFIKITDLDLRNAVTVADHKMVMDDISKESLFEKIRKTF